jgi:hypothetical protein
LATLDRDEETARQAIIIDDLRAIIGRAVIAGARLLDRQPHLMMDIGATLLTLLDIRHPTHETIGTVKKVILRVKKVCTKFNVEGDLKSTLRSAKKLLKKW